MGVKREVKLLSAYIYIVEGSQVSTLTLADVKEKLQRYVDMTKKTGEQLGWPYSEAAFPYVIEERPEENWILLRGKNPDEYKYIIIGVGSKELNGKETPYVQVSLPEVATHGDKGKANEYCRFLAREFKAELHLFNGRIQYFQPRK